MCLQAIQSEIVSLCADIHRAEYRLLELIEQLDTSRPWRHEHMPSCAHWLNAHCGLDLVTAREKVRIAHALPKLPLIRDAFRLGELSYSKVRAITRVADWSNEAELVAVARAKTAAHVVRIVKEMRQVERLRESHAAFAAYRHRTFASHTDEVGTLIFEGRLPAEQGELLLQALDRAMGWLFRGQPHRERMRYDVASKTFLKTFVVPMPLRSWPSSSWRSRHKQRKDSARPTDINSWCTLPRKRCRSTARSRPTMRRR